MLIAYLPAVVFVGVIALFPVKDIPKDFLPSYGDYYGFVIAAIMVFASLVAPEVLCTDRRSGMLGVYLSSPLDQTTYLVAKAAAIAAVISLVCLGPPLLVLVANLLQSQGPTGFGDIVTTLARVIGAGVALTPAIAWRSPTPTDLPMNFRVFSIPPAGPRGVTTKRATHRGTRTTVLSLLAGSGGRWRPCHRPGPWWPS